MRKVFFRRPVSLRMAVVVLGFRLVLGGGGLLHEQFAIGCKRVMLKSKLTQGFQCNFC